MGLCQPWCPLSGTPGWGVSVWQCAGTAGDIPESVCEGEGFQACQCDKLFWMLFAREGMSERGT